MSKNVLIIAPSGAGKTSSVRTLESKETFLFNALKKDLPWKGSAKQYTYLKKGEDGEFTGNMYATSDSKVVEKFLDYINTDMLHIKNVIIDDNTFLTALELHRRKSEGWDRFDIILDNFLKLVEKSKNLREDLTVFFMHHVKTEGDGLLEEKSMSAMSYGKALDQKMGSMEAHFTVVLRAAKESDGNTIDYVFYTRDAHSTVKTPIGMFETEKIPNDLKMVKDAINCYYNEEC